jgi:UDP-N-acetylglucosamine 2-epimerase
MITVVYGTRPEAIKLAPLVKELRGRKANVRVVSTGQHYELLRGVDLVPDIELALMETNQSPSEFLSRALKRLDDILKDGAKWVVVQGDTATAFAAALAAFHLRIPVAHVEAGLRTCDLTAPFPEEGYRQMIDRIADRLYAPTDVSVANLVREHVAQHKILVTGNTGVDAALQAVSFGLGHCEWPTPFVLATLHRRESFGAPMQSVCRALLRVVHASDLHVVLPVHPNPTVRDTVEAMFRGETRIHLTAPLAYVDLLAAMQQCLCVLTDSGGIQEEAPAFGVPVLVARETTERPEAIDAGASQLVGFDEETIVRAVVRLREHPEVRAAMAVPRQIFGDGMASKRIADDLLMKT